MYPFLTTFTLIYPKITTFTHTYPKLTAFTHIYPKLTAFTLIFPKLTAFTHIYPKLTAFTLIYPKLTTFTLIYPKQEKMRGQRGRLPVRPLGYVMSTKVIFRRAEVFRDVRMQANLGPMFERKYIFISLPRAPSFSLVTKNLRARQDCMRTSRKTDFR